MEGNSVSQTYPKSRARWIASPEKVGKTFSKLGTHMLVVEKTLVCVVPEGAVPLGLLFTTPLTLY